MEINNLEIREDVGILVSFLIRAYLAQETRITIFYNDLSRNEKDVVNALNRQFYFYKIGSGNQIVRVTDLGKNAARELIAATELYANYKNSFKL